MPASATLRSSPMTPMMVRSSPRERLGRNPCSWMRATTPWMSCSDAPFFMTTITALCSSSVQVGAQHPRAPEVDVPHVAGRPGVDVDEHANGARQGPRHGDLPRADHGDHAPAAPLARGARREVGVEVVGHREDGPDDLLGPDAVLLDDGAAELGHAVLDGLDRVGVDLGRSPDSAHEEPSSLRVAGGWCPPARAAAAARSALPAQRAPGACGHPGDGATPFPAHPPLGAPRTRGAFRLTRA